jgi:hypothetical protein
MHWLFVLSLLLAGPAFAQKNFIDWERERLWAEEISSNIVVGNPVYLEVKGQPQFLNIYTKVPGSKTAVIILHGMRRHPDWNLIGVLRIGLADAGYSTFSMQLPVLGLGAKFEHYVPFYPEAAARVKAGVDFLKNQEGFDRVAIVSHSIASRITNWYLWNNEGGAPVDAWASVGIVAGIYDWIDAIPCPVLDLYAEKDFQDVLWQAARRKDQMSQIKGARQVMVPGVDHFFEGHEDTLVEYVKTFLDEVLAGRPKAASAAQ